MKNTLFLLLITFLTVGCRSDETIENIPPSPDLIELQTKVPTFISPVQVDYEGEITKTNQEEILFYGMLIGDKGSITVDLNLGNQTKEYTSGDKTFKGSFYDLEGGKNYYLRFYVKTEKTVYYGNIINFESKKHHSPTEEYIYLNTQQKVDDFGQNKYTYVSNLTIGGDVVDLSPLSSIIKIGKNLDIQDARKLTKLNGLGNLQIIGTDVMPNGRLQIFNNSKLETLSGLDKLMFTGRLLVGFNPLLNNLQGLGKLEQAWHSTFLTVPSFDGLPLNFRTGEFESRGFQGTDLGNRTINCEAYSFTLKDAPNITTMKGFIIGNYQNTTTFKLENCNNLKNLEGIVFPSKYDKIIILNCENFESLKGLGNLTTLGGISLKDLPKLKRLEGLEKLTQIDGLYLNNISISNFVGLNSIKTLESLLISACNNLINFEGLSQLTKIGDEISYFDVSNCQNLENFVGLEKVQHFTRFNIDNLPKLKSFEGIRQAKMPYISIQYCNLISSLQGLENVYGTGNIAIFENQNLQNFCAIKNIVGSLNPNSYYVYNNLSNPTQEDIKNNCQ